MQNLPFKNDESLDHSLFLRSLFDIAVQRAQPLHALKMLQSDPKTRVLPDLPTNGKGRVLVLGAGKAAASMAHAIETLIPRDVALSGLVVTRYEHTPKSSIHSAPRIEIIEAAHPVPDFASLQAAKRMLKLTENLSEDDLVLCLISGGGSSLLTLPALGVTLEEKQAINRELLRCGASIFEINCVRKHLSQIKGGRLALACAKASQVVTLAISDVPNDDPSVIASGLTVADSTTCLDALDILMRYQINVSEIILQNLKNGFFETPKARDFLQNQDKNNNKYQNKYQFHLIATPKQALQAAAQAAKDAGFHAYILSDNIEGESREVAKVHAALARFIAKQSNQNDFSDSFTAFQKPCVILSGGETTVTLRSQNKALKTGRGGRASEFCLSLALALQGEANIWALAADTDGIDGSENNAGAQINPETLNRAMQKGLNPNDYLERHDSYSFFESLNDLIISGATFTNVNDFRAILIM